MVSYRFVSMKQKKGYIRLNQVNQLIEYYQNLANKYPEDSVSWRSRVRIGLAIYILWKTGRRVSEIVGHNRNPSSRFHGLRPRDINIEDMEITFSILKKTPKKLRLKSGEMKDKEKMIKEDMSKQVFEEIIPCDKELIDVLEYWIEKLEIKEWERIIPYSRQYLDIKLKRAAKQLNMFLPGEKKGQPLRISCHSFRHGYSVNFLKKNKDNPAALPILQELLAHSDINVTKTYLRFDNSDMRVLINKAGKEEEDNGE